MAKRILVPLDQSPLAEAVLPLVGEVGPCRLACMGRERGLFARISFCLCRFKSVAVELKTEQSKSMRSDPLSRSQRNCAAIDLPHEGGGEDYAARHMRWDATTGR